MIGEYIRRKSPQMSGADAHEGTSARRDRSVRLAEYSVRFFMGLTLSGARVFGVLSPFAIGMTAVPAGVGAAIATFFGAAVGYLLFGTFAWAVKYMAVAMLISTVTVVFRDTEVYRSSWFMPVAAAFITACITFVSAAEAGWQLSATALLLTDTALAGGSAFFYRTALSPWSGRLDFDRRSEIMHTVSVLILVATVLISLSGIMFFGVLSLGRTAAVLLVLLSAYKGGVGMGCTTGVAIGLAMDTASGGAPLFAAVYGFAGLVSGIFSKQSRFVFVLAFVLVDAAAAALAAQNAGVPAILYETFAASVIFMVLPQSAMVRLNAFIPGSEGGGGLAKAREYTKSRVDQASLAFRDLYETVRQSTTQTENDNDVAKLFDRAADRVCKSCERTAECWSRSYQTTLDVMNNITPRMLERGKLSESDFPDYFSGECLNIRYFTSAVNDELKGLFYRRQYRSKLRENQTAAFNQYSEMSAILNGISQELGNSIGFEPELEWRLIKYLQSLGMTPEAAVFRDRGGRLHAEISGASISSLTGEPDYLNKLSAALGVRLCAEESRRHSDKLTLLEAEPLAAAVGISCLKKDGRGTSGDKGAYFKTDEGLLYVILSDGMGSGAEAAQYSGDAVRILERFLRSGVAAETAVRMLNDLLLLKNETELGCATVDLFCINLFTGEMRMFKYGAAPSYLKQGGSVKRMRGKSLAAGLGTPPNDAPDSLTMDMKAGSVAVIVSDGVTSGMEDAWLEDAIMQYEGANPRELSGKIVETASEKFKAEDDMTVIAIQISYRT